MIDLHIHEVPRLLIPYENMSKCEENDYEGLLSFSFSASELKRKLGKTI